MKNNRSIRAWLVFSAIMAGIVPARCQDNGSTGTVLSRAYSFINVQSGDNPSEFKPLTQGERNRAFVGSFRSPVWLVKTAASAGFHQWSDDPEEWEQGGSGYGKRYADVLGQYAIRNAVRFGLESVLHEDNRYFASGKKGFGPRLGYALSSGILARHDNGKRYPSASLLAGLASGAGISRLWQPPSSDSAGNAATRFAITAGWNVGLGVLKEFMPDLLRPIIKRK